MSARQNMKAIRNGMTVYAADGQSIGTVERMERKALFVGKQSIPETAVARVTADGVYLDGSYAAAGQQEGQMRVAVAEERLSVGTREVEQGAIEIRKTVTEEQVSVPVTLHSDEVTVQERAIEERPLRVGETAFEEGTVRMQLRGEEAVVAKEAVVTGEVVVDKGQVAEERQISDTVRKEHVDVDENYRQAATGGTVAAQAAVPGEMATETRRTTETSATGGDNWQELREEVREGGTKTNR